MKTTSFLRLAVAFLLASAGVVCAQSDSPSQTTSRQGGGFTDGGLLGQYFANPEGKGEPAFQRRDVRLRFDWGMDHAVGGSNGPAYQTLPKTGFSVKWSGSIIPRFTEPYVFRAGAGDRLTLRIRETGGQWTDLIDLKTAGVTNASPYAMTAGKTYDVEVLYGNSTRPAFCWLEWSSPSTPGEVIDPLAGSAINASSWTHSIFADYAIQGRWMDPTTVDNDGWPTSDASLLIGEMGETYQGTYLIQFEGQGAVTSSAGGSVFESGANSFPVQTPAGTGYDPKTNLTTLKLRVTQQDGHWYLRFKETRRHAQDALGTGFRLLRVMRPLVADSLESHALGEVVYRPIKEAFAPYTVIRWLEVANVPCEAQWEERTDPAYFGLRRTYADQNTGGECWERLVMLANECGKDLYICLPVRASDAYVRKLALLLRNGSDGKNPYEKPVANPAYPPLNSNLRVYVEFGNEIWNWGFASTQDARKMAEEAIKSNAPEAAIFNFDGKGNYRTWHAMRTAQVSDVFRAVFGDEAMGDRVRVLLEYQYDNAQETAWQSLRFLDGYYNKGTADGERPARAVKDIIWGAGGATYYGTGNGYGTQNEIFFADPGFEKTVVPEGKPPFAADNRGAWKFEGVAGIYRSDSVAVSVDASPEAQPEPLKNDTALGFAFTVGDHPIYVRSLGCWFQNEEERPHPVRIVRAQDGVVVAQTDVTKVLRYMQQFEPGFRYTALTREGKPDAIKLEAKTVYYIVGLAKAGERYQQTDFLAQATPGIAVKESVTGTEDGGKWIFTANNQPGIISGLLNFRFTFSEQVPDTGFPPPPDGSQAAYLYGTGAFSTTLQVAKPGAYALSFYAAGAGGYWPGYIPFDLYVNNEKISPKAQNDFRVAPGETPAGIGGFNRPTTSFEEAWGSAVFVVERPGPVEIRIEGKGKEADKWTVFDRFSVAGVDEIMESGLGRGSAFGQVAQSNYRKQLFNQATYAKSFGLEVVAYEAGWSLGGDFHSAPIQNYAKFKDARAREINNTAMDLFTQSGSFLNVWGVYLYCPAFDLAHAMDYPLMQSLQDLGRRLPAESENGVPVPGSLTSSNCVRWIWSDAQPKIELKERGAWKSWLVLAPETADYAFKIAAAGNGRLEIEADGQLLGALANGSEAPLLKVKLTKGTHGIRVRNMGGEWNVDSIHVSR